MFDGIILTTLQETTLPKHKKAQLENKPGKVNSDEDTLLMGERTTILNNFDPIYLVLN